MGIFRRLKTGAARPWLIFFFLAAGLLFTSMAQSQTITSDGTSISLPKLFKQIRRETGYVVAYNEADIKGVLEIRLPKGKLSLADALEKALRANGLTYKISSKTIFVSKVKKAALVQQPESQPLTVESNRIDVKGRVVDELGIPLSGITVTIRNSIKGMATDQMGHFYFADVSSNALVVVQGIGYGTQELLVAKEMLVELKRNVSGLDEVQVIAYGTITKRLNTGSVSSVNGREIANQPVTNPLAALAGRVPGLVITQTTGLPGGAFKVEVRGRTAIDRTISDDQPLIVIDGVPYGPNNGYLSTQISAIGNPTNSPGANSPGGISPLNSINPQDIESVEVLKDADATAIYGSRGANGVMLITTKKGKAGKTQVNFNGYTGISDVTRNVRMMNTTEYIKMRETAFLNDNAKPTASNAYDLLKWDTTRNTDFMKMFTGKSAISNDLQLSVTGGSAGTQFFIGGSFNRQTNVMPGDFSYKRGTMHFNFTHSSTNNRFRLTFSGSLNSDVNNLMFSDLSVYNYLPPNLILYDDKGDLAWNEGGVVSFSNPLSYLKTTYTAKNKGAFSSLLMNYKITEDITARISTGYNLTLLKEISLWPIASTNPANSDGTGNSTFSDNQYTSWIIEPQLEYSPKLSRGKLNVLVGATAQATDQDGKTISAYGYTSDDLLASLAGATSFTATNQASQYRYNAFFGRINYNWLNKYLLNFSGRRDGSSRFAPENRFANFGAGGVAWIFTNEPFLLGEDILSFGKMRASYGVTGNDKISDYQYLDTWASVNGSYEGRPGLYPNKLYNPDYHWEKTKKLELALELGFLKDRILFSTAFYRNRSSNQLVQYPLPTTTGFNNIIDNLPALVENRGWEFTLNAAIFKKKVFNWKVAANLTVPKNTLVSYPGLATSSYNGLYVEGHSLNVIYKYKYLGVDQQTGLFTFQDVDGNGKMSIVDRQALGATDPKFYGGLSNALSYGGFQFDFFFSFTRQTGKNYLSNLRSMPGSLNNLPALMTDFWMKPGDNARFQRLSATSSQPLTAWNLFRGSDGIYEDASFIRLKNAALSYSLPQVLLEKLHFNSCRLYMQAQNLFTITRYQLGDPETQSLLRTPPMRTVTFGLQMIL